MWKGCGRINGSPVIYARVDFVIATLSVHQDSLDHFKNFHNLFIFHEMILIEVANYSETRVEILLLEKIMAYPLCLNIVRIDLDFQIPPFAFTRSERVVFEDLDV